MDAQEHRKVTMVTESNDNGMPLRMLTVREVAAVLNIHPNTVRRWESKRLLKSYKIGPRRSTRFKQEDIVAFLDKCEKQALVGTTK
jgi:excisionase family DNA binding protein